MFDNNTIVFNENKNIEDKRRYAYEKAIEAYWKHVDRYHTWMNYYAVFNGALFVGFCTLLTATSNIEFKNSIELSNNYTILCIIICIVGFISSVCWFLSILGHASWERNWINIVEYYELKIFSDSNNNRVYNMLITEADSISADIEIKDNIMLNDDAKMKYGFSTHASTRLFVFILIVSWIILVFYQCIIKLNTIKCFCLPVLSIIIYGAIVIFYKSLDTNGYSNIKGKVWKCKNIEEWN